MLVIATINHSDPSQLVIARMEYVVKKLVDAGQERGRVTLDEATDLLTSDIICLKRMVAFTSAFMARAIRMGAEISGMSCSCSTYL